MANAATKLTVKTDTSKAPAATPSPWRPFEDLRREVDHLFEDFGRGWLTPSRPASFDLEPVFRSEFTFKAPVVDIAEKDAAYEITAELPGIDAKDVEVTLKNGNIVISGEKSESKETKDKDYHVQERQYGSFERSFALPKGVDADKIAAEVKNGVLTVTLPKTAEAQKPSKKVEVKAAA